MIFARLELLTVIVPLLLLVGLARRRRKKNFLAHPLLAQMRAKIAPASRIVHAPKLLEYAALAFVLLAALDPVLPSGEYLLKRQGLDIVLILDLSSSMQEPMDSREARRLWREKREMGRSRLDAVKDEMIRFVARRQHDRLGLVVFSENGYVVAPLTHDAAYLAHYLAMVDHQTLASEGQTAIGEGIVAALRLAEQLRPGGERHGRLMVVLTDGENNTGRDPFAAVREAVAAGFKIHFIGMDIEKTPSAARLIAAVRAAGGKYYDVRDGAQLKQVYLDIDRLEKGTFLTRERGTFIPRYDPFALAAFVLLVLALALRTVPFFTEIS